MDLQTSPALPGDQAAIDALLDQCFGLSRHTKTSYRLREGNTAIPALSRVVRDSEHGLTGAISFWPVTIGRSKCKALLLGPLAVHPACQNRGIGRMLMRECLDTAKQLGYALVLLVGDEPYYARVGFKRVENASLLLPGPNNRDRFLYLELQPDIIGTVSGMVLPPHRQTV